MRHLQALIRRRLPTTGHAVMTAAVCATALLVMPSAGLASAPVSPSVELVLDASASMWAPLPDGVPRMAAARLAVLDLLDAVPDARTRISVRTFGGAAEARLGETCTATSAIPQSSLTSELEAVRPGGPAPLIAAMRAAVDDLQTAGEGRTIVLVTSGEDQCHADSGPLMRSLGAADPPIAIRVVGVGLPPEVEKSFAAITTTTNADTATELADALRRALSDLEVDPAGPRSVEIDLSGLEGDPGGRRIEIFRPTGGDGLQIEAGDDLVAADLAPGRVVLRVLREGDDEPTLVAIGRIADGEDHRIRLGPPPAEATSPRGWCDPPPVAGAGTFVEVPADPGGRDRWLTVDPVASPPGAWTARTVVPVGGGRVELPLTDRPGEVEARLWLDAGPDLSLLVWSQRCAPTLVPVELVAAERLETDAGFAVAWTGPMAPGDRVALARQDAGEWDWSACADADQGTAASLQTPSAPGGYELRYLSGRSGQVLARVPVELYRVPARIYAPEEVVAGRPLEIRWEGPDDRTDFVTVVPAAAPEGTYRAFAPTSSGSPVMLTAPSEPGSYEIRYVAGASEATLASRPLEVVPIEVTLQVPPRARAGGRFEVLWTGPARSDDTITVALPGWPPQRSMDWAYATMGSPVSLAAPEEPGTYEVRYVEGGSRSILAHAPIEVR